MKRFALIAVLTVCLVSAPVYAPALKGYSKTHARISSQAQIYYRQTNPARSFQLGYANSGVVTSDFGWADPYGTFFTTHHIDLLKSSGGKTVIIMLTYEAWQQNPTVSAMNMPYRDAIKTLTEYGKSQNISVVLSLFRWFFSVESYRDNSNFPWRLRQAIICDYSSYHEYSQDSIIYNPQDLWVQWGIDVINYCKPHVIGTMHETTGVISFQELYDFNYRCINTWRGIDPSIWCMVYGGCWKNGGDGDPLKIWKTMPLPFKHVYYDMHLYYRPDKSSSGWTGAYEDGNFALGKQLLYEKLDSRFGSLENIWYGEFGGWRKRELKHEIPNWDVVLKDVYDYCRQRDIGCSQCGFFKATFTMLTTDHMSLNEVGEFWKENL